MVWGSLDTIAVSWILAKISCCWCYMNKNLISRLPVLSNWLFVSKNCRQSPRLAQRIPSFLMLGCQCFPLLLQLLIELDRDAYFFFLIFDLKIFSICFYILRKKKEQHTPNIPSESYILACSVKASVVLCYFLSCELKLSSLSQMKTMWRKKGCLLEERHKGLSCTYRKLNNKTMI